MHELGVLLAVVEQVTEVAKENDVQKIQKLVLQVGELSSMIPKYMKKIYPAAVDGSILEGSELEIETIPGNGRCKQCGTVYHLIEEHGICPDCGEQQFELLSGKEFFIKEIVAY